MKVQIIEYKTESVVKEIFVKSEREAQRVEDGININLNHDNYFTKIVQ